MDSSSSVVGDGETEALLRDDERTRERKGGRPCFADLLRDELTVVADFLDGKGRDAMRRTSRVWFRGVPASAAEAGFGRTGVVALARSVWKHRWWRWGRNLPRMLLVVLFLLGVAVVHGPFQSCALGHLTRGTQMATAGVCLAVAALALMAVVEVALEVVSWLGWSDGVRAGLVDLWFARGVGPELGLGPDPTLEFWGPPRPAFVARPVGDVRRRALRLIGRFLVLCGGIVLHVGWALGWFSSSCRGCAALAMVFYWSLLWIQAALRCTSDFASVALRAAVLFPLVSLCAPFALDALLLVAFGATRARAWAALVVSPLLYLVASGLCRSTESLWESSRLLDEAAGLCVLLAPGQEQRRPAKTLSSVRMSMLVLLVVLVAYAGYGVGAVLSREACRGACGDAVAFRWTSADDDDGDVAVRVFGLNAAADRFLASSSSTAETGHLAIPDVAGHGRLCSVSSSNTSSGWLVPWARSTDCLVELDESPGNVTLVVYGAPERLVSLESFALRVGLADEVARAVSLMPAALFVVDFLDNGFVLDRLDRAAERNETGVHASFLRARRRPEDGDYFWCIMSIPLMIALSSARWITPCEIREELHAS